MHLFLRKKGNTKSMRVSSSISQELTFWSENEGHFGLKEKQG